MKKAHAFLAVAALWLTAACTTQIDADYPKYLANNQGAVTFTNTKVADQADYYLTPKTDNHSYQFRAFMGGVANSWVIDFGRILDATMNGEDIKTAFAEVRKADSAASGDNLLLVFDLNSYIFEGFEAQVAMTVTARHGARELISKRYQATGISQGGKMFWGGAFAMKNAVQQSTKSAVDQILTAFIADLDKVYEDGEPIAEGDSPAGPGPVVRRAMPSPGAA